MHGRITEITSANTTQEQDPPTPTSHEQEEEISKASWTTASNLYQGSTNNTWRITTNRKLLICWSACIHKLSIYLSFRADSKMPRNRKSIVLILCKYEFRFIGVKYHFLTLRSERCCSMYRIRIIHCLLRFHGPREDPCATFLNIQHFPLLMCQNHLAFLLCTLLCKSYHFAMRTLHNHHRAHF